MPCGISAGAAVAAATGIGVLHLGSDGAGSIRTPSSFCGTFGLKPSFGRVPAYPPSPLGLLSHHGPMARTVADAALMLTVIARPDHRDPYALPPENRDWHYGIEDGIAGWRVGFSPDLGYARVDPEIAAAAAAAARRFEALGAVVEQVEPIFESPRDALFTLWASGTAALLRAYPDERKRLVDPGLLATAAAGEGIGAAEWVEADLVRTALGRRMAAFHQRYDLLLMPTMPVAALPAGQDLNDPAHERHWIDWSPFSYPFNMTRQPAASICCGLTGAGLPIGLQIVGPLYRDDRVLRAARAFETTQPQRRPPPLV
jgi:aspartyl-tRNA(Asn)/glutamyl-tRNA(Gln) amidotransferase subunit A